MITPTTTTHLSVRAMSKFPVAQVGLSTPFSVQIAQTIHGQLGHQYVHLHRGLCSRRSELTKKTTWDCLRRLAACLLTLLAALLEKTSSFYHFLLYNWKKKTKNRSIFNYGKLVIYLILVHMAIWACLLHLSSSALISNIFHPIGERRLDLEESLELWWWVAKWKFVRREGGKRGSISKEEHLCIKEVHFSCYIWSLFRAKLYFQS